MDQDRHRRFCPAIDTMRYRFAWFYSNDLRQWTGRAAAAVREPLSTGRIEVALRHTRVASVYGVSAVAT
jgi:hypothetical protein